MSLRSHFAEHMHWATVQAISILWNKTVPRNEKRITDTRGDISVLQKVVRLGSGPSFPIIRNSTDAFVRFIYLHTCIEHKRGFRTVE